MASPTSLTLQRMQYESVPRIGSLVSILHLISAIDARCDRKDGIRPIAPGTSSQLNSEKFPSVAA
jgi:hypothetical protein